MQELFSEHNSLYWAICAITCSVEQLYFQVFFSHILHGNALKSFFSADSFSESWYLTHKLYLGDWVWFF